MSDQSGGDGGGTAPQKRVVNRKSKTFAALYRQLVTAQDASDPGYELFELNANTTQKAFEEIGRDPDRPDGEYTIVQICSEPKEKRTVTKSELV